ncbi:hypothetical protein [Fibrobacter sp. UBA4297]|uniref:hypothetical protein n=1 Tax=Fibrobacter sp. UBA4297 TaxID=1946536 RepID=UPI0025C41F11|nr:hypothetical protein [Fibrobacter sp. UBA4297]
MSLLDFLKEVNLLPGKVGVFDSIEGLDITGYFRMQGVILLIIENGSCTIDMAIRSIIKSSRTSYCRSHLNALASCIGKMRRNRHRTARKPCSTRSTTILSFESADGLRFSIGSLFVVAATLCWGFKNNCARKISNKSTYQIVTVKGLCSGLGAIAISVFTRETHFDMDYIPVTQTDKVGKAHSPKFF